MLSKVQKNAIKQLHTKKGRSKLGLCLVEGAKSIATAGKAVEFTFTRKDTDSFDKLVTTETPQDIAAVARIPKWAIDDIEKHPTIVVLDGVQDPGNVGSILRLCLAFNAALILVDSADVTNPKVIRSSAGSLFQVPWLSIKRLDAMTQIRNLKRSVYKLEKKPGSKILNNKLSKSFEKKIVLIAGSEGQGIKLKINGTSIQIPHSRDLESLNVTHALAIILFEKTTASHS